MIETIQELKKQAKECYREGVIKFNGIDGYGERVKESLKYFEKASQLGYSEACYHLQYMYSTEECILKNMRISDYYGKKAELLGKIEKLTEDFESEENIE